VALIAGSDPVSGVPPTLASLAEAIERQSYLVSEELVAALFVAVHRRQPLFVEGEPGVGKTELAKALASALGARLIRLQCYEGIDVHQALYDWDHVRQLLYLRVAQEAGHGEQRLMGELYGEEFLLRRPLLDALTAEGEVVLLIDEIDRADDEFEAFLLELLSDFQISIPEIGTIRAARRPFVVLTSNRTRDVHDALKRRCLYHWLDYPDAERELRILKLRMPEVEDDLGRQLCEAVRAMREMTLHKPPGIGETLDWASALALLGLARLDDETLRATIGSVLKVREDQEHVRDEGVAVLLGDER
jgi:MoxR-like ATPase